MKKVLIAKPGLDGHDRGAIVVAQYLKDAGMNVIYTGIRQTPLQVVSAAIDEDVDVIGISCLSGAHKELMKEIMKLLTEKKVEDKKVVIGGIIPEEDITFLKEIGVDEVFTPGISLETIKYKIENL